MLSCDKCGTTDNEADIFGVDATPDVAGRGIAGLNICAACYTQAMGCSYCGRTMPLSDVGLVPDKDDGAEWARLAGHHKHGCEWIATRAHRVGV